MTLATYSLWHILFSIKRNGTKDNKYTCYIDVCMKLSTNVSTVLSALWGSTIKSQCEACYYLLWLCLKCGRQHVGEKFQRYRKKKLHERYYDEHQEGEQPEDICTCSEELKRKMFCFLRKLLSGKVQKDNSKKKVPMKTRYRVRFDTNN